LPESARRVLQSVIEHGYEQFIELVAEYRGKTTDEVDDIAQGRVWTGTQARDRGLVDQLGTLEEAVAAAARIAGIAERYDTVYVAPSMSPFERFFADMGARALAWSGLERAISRAAWWPGNDLYRRMLGQFAEIEAASSARRPAEPMAHCLCEPPM
jgi:protease-4